MKFCCAPTWGVGVEGYCMNSLISTALLLGKTQRSKRRLRSRFKCSRIDSTCDPDLLNEPQFSCQAECGFSYKRRPNKLPLQHATIDATGHPRLPLPVSTRSLGIICKRGYTLIFICRRQTVKSHVCSPMRQSGTAARASSAG